ncbi:TIGR02996 domain-containing protein [Pyxidicoccus xibeiensis]|uniref:TIGR02996 domain-containing protein n=1 Tax=Pyxidicoccus xibeiensis TaxID=2906759 RepID=UPI0020A7EED4|nr:TIGR02996 domain-containing protein [Pyxidicoccus xibeiensis]MCP3143794.1 TIGR02996 domain-containing protein [Pyxidicoccus xibeiensis]
MSDILAERLGRALASFERYEEEDALQSLLEGWSESRDERIARLIERLSVSLPAGLAPFTGPIELSQLVEDFQTVAAHRYPRGSSIQLIDIQKWHPDPRLTPGALALADMPVAHKPTPGFWLCELLSHVKDPRALEPLRAIHATLAPGTPFAFRLEGVIEGIARQRVSRPGAEASALCDALEEALTRREEATARSAPLREVLFTSAVASPDDDGPRLVLADLLLEHGDPLGEFIALQCGSQPDEARIARLLELHRTKWELMLGIYADGPVRFERGFPVAVKLSIPERRERRHWDEMRLPPPRLEWGTVRVVDWNWTGDEEQADWLAHPHLRGVTVLRKVNAAMAQRLGRHPLPVRRLELRGPLTRDAPGVFTSLAALPHLVHVEVQEAGPQDVHLCASSPLAQRLACFEAAGSEAWLLSATPAAEVPIEATLCDESGCAALAEVLRAAEGFSTRALRLHSRPRLNATQRGLLEQAATAYSRVEWSVRSAFW